jgi:ABC-type glycerol-3-phosphate transport system substrate-binding protein
MRLSGRSLWAVIVIILLVGTMAPLAVLQAQTPTTMLTLAVPSFSSVSVDDKLLADFVASHPGVGVSIVNRDAGIPRAAGSIDKHLEEVQKYASSADVLYVDSYRLTVEGTRAGYFLDLAPLVAEDKTLNTADFYPAVWQAFQWDRGVWALPTATDPLILMYRPSAFDKAGLAYPAKSGR